MTLAPHSAVALRQISETERGERSRRAAAGALVLAAVERVIHGTTDEFGMRRARREAEGLERSPEKSILLRVLIVLEEAADPCARVGAPLVQYACELERTRRLPEANAAASLALVVDAGSAATALHAARLARKLGERERALALYCAARDLDGGSGVIARLAAVGEAVVGIDPERDLTRAVRSALRAGDAESAAVGLEERAAVRRARGNRAGAARDLCLAAARGTGAVPTGAADGGALLQPHGGRFRVPSAQGGADGARQVALGIDPHHRLADGGEPRDHAGTSVQIARGAVQRQRAPWTEVPA
ncbi:MAG TPA: hypothetical protein VE913_00235 [Longimicrobium sp.]|nr:hypothetical protein [Longimicrobium sp.]